jgi:hypothetical protein
MSLNIYLFERTPCIHCDNGIVSRDVGDFNFSHSYGEMASVCHIYPFLWRAPECGITKASQLVMPLEHAISVIRDQKDRCLNAAPDGGWGGASGEFLCKLKKLLEVCKEYPNAEINTSR